jgi:hypothetical protein
MDADIDASSRAVTIGSDDATAAIGTDRVGCPTDVDAQGVAARPDFIEGVAHERHVPRENPVADEGIRNVELQAHRPTGFRRAAVAVDDDVVERREPHGLGDLAAQDDGGPLPNVVRVGVGALLAHSLAVVHRRHVKPFVPIPGASRPVGPTCMARMLSSG